MELIISNTNFENIGLIDNAVSVIWDTNYYEAGRFEIYVSSNEKNLSLLKTDFYVSRKDDEYVGIIESINITGDVESGEYITASGRFLLSILDRRIVWSQTQLGTTVENGIRNLITASAISPIDSDRKIDNLELGIAKRFTERLDKQITGKNLLAETTEICQSVSIGQKINLVNGKFQFNLYKGVNRSYSQSENPHVVFSDKYDNLLKSNYTYDKTSLKNVCLVAGEGEGLERKTATAYVGKPKGLDRREMYADARNASSNNGNISDTEYYAALTEQGNEELAKTLITEVFEGEVEISNQYKYRVDFNIGDIVTIENSKWGIFINTRIIDIIESEDENGIKLVPTFGI